MHCPDAAGNSSSTMDSYLGLLWIHVLGRHFIMDSAHSLGQVTGNHIYIFFLMKITNYRKTLKGCREVNYKLSYFPQEIKKLHISGL